jgi:short-subunit dehydrogenase
MSLPSYLRRIGKNVVVVARSQDKLEDLVAQDEKFEELPETTPGKK